MPASSPIQGGFYRVSRGVELKILSGRNLASKSFGTGDQAWKEVPSNLKWYAKVGFGGGAIPLSERSDKEGKGADASGEKTIKNPPQSPEVLEDDVLCAIHICGELSARTSTQGTVSRTDSPMGSLPTSDQSPIWNETFTFQNLPRFDSSAKSSSTLQSLANRELLDYSGLRIMVYRIPKKTTLTFERLVPKRINNPPSNNFGATLTPPLASKSYTPPDSTSPTSSSFSTFDTPNTTTTQVLMGKVDIPLSTFRKGTPVTGYFPIVGELGNDKNRGGVTYGDLKLSIKIDE